MNKTGDRRRQSRFEVMQNLGEPVDIQVIKNNKKTTIPGFILNLSAGGMRVITLGEQASELSIGTPVFLDLELPHIHPFNIEAKIVSIQRGEKAKLHGSDGEWVMSLSFTKIKASDAAHINHLGEDWNNCEAKIQFRLPDVCFRQCSCWDFCDKPVKLKLSESE
jgi:c-di-GMP-binding flagellar brake protein YcgR